jgi:hypothetical protein
MKSIAAGFALVALLCPIAGTAGAPRPGGQAGLGAVLTSKDGGQIFGFDLNRNGNDGVLAEAQTVNGNGDELVSVEVFNQNTGKIKKQFARYQGQRNEYGVDGIFAGDVALLTHFVRPPGEIFAKRKYQVMNPVTAKMFTGKWTPPIKDIDVRQAGVNQETAASVLFAIELKKQDNPVLIVSDIASNTFSNIIPLDPARFGLANGPVLSQYTGTKAVIAFSPDGGAVGGAAPLNAIVDLESGSVTTFSGFNNGAFHAGYVNGLAVDPTTGIGATTTELNSQVEFYDMGARTKLNFVQLPCTDNTDQLNSGAGIAVDPVNHLFLVTDPLYCDGSQGSAVVVYDEAGNLIESITGFNFPVGEPAPVINPSKRMGWAFGGPGGFNQLQQFFY